MGVNTARMISIRRTVSSSFEERWARYTTPRRHIDCFSRRHHSARNPMRRKRQSLAKRRDIPPNVFDNRLRRRARALPFERGILGVEIGGSAPWSLYTVGQILAHCPTPFDRRPHQGRRSPLTIEFICRSQAAATVISTPQNRGAQMPTSTNADILRALYLPFF